MKDFIKYYIKVTCVSFLIYAIAEFLLYSQVGSIIEWITYVLCFLSAIGVVEVFKHRKEVDKDGKE